jgi:hypothetical protein
MARPLAARLAARRVSSSSIRADGDETEHVAPPHRMPVVTRVLVFSKANSEASPSRRTTGVPR